MEKYMTPKALVRAAEEVDRIAEALGVPNDACLLVSPPNADPNPPYRLEKASLAVQQAEKLVKDLEGDPERFSLDRITAALTITLLKRATEELRDTAENWRQFIDSMTDPPDGWI